MNLGDGLMTQANPQGGDGGGELPQNIETDPGLIRVAWAGRQQNRIGLQVPDLLQGCCQTRPR